MITQEKLRNIIYIITLIIFVCSSFYLGRHWESYRIKIQLQKDGVATSRWGDNDWYVITGSIEEFNAYRRP